MSSVAHHFVRRAVDAAQYAHSAATSANTSDGEKIKELAPWGILLLAATGIMYLIAVASINYTYGHVVAALTMVETPTAIAFKSTANESVEVDAPLLSKLDESEKQGLEAIETDLFLVKQQPITAKLCTAVKHLRAVGGRWARFRGLHVAILYNFVGGFFINTLAGRHHLNPLRPVVTVLVSVALFRIDLLWTHIVISNPSSKPWYRRSVPIVRKKGILIATAACAAAQELAIYLPALFLVPSPQNPADVFMSLGAAAMSLVSIFLVVIPAQVTLTRVQASMLADEDETIVPFDRSFGGRMTPEILGGNGCVGMVDAWRSFDKEARFRLIKLYLKIVAIQIFAAIFFVMTIVGELRLIMGDDFNKGIEIIRKHIKHEQAGEVVITVN